MTTLEKNPWKEVMMTTLEKNPWKEVMMTTLEKNPWKEVMMAMLEKGSAGQRLPGTGDDRTPPPGFSNSRIQFAEAANDSRNEPGAHYP